MRSFFAIPNNLLGAIASPRSTKFSNVLYFCLIYFALNTLGAIASAPTSVYDFPWMNVVFLSVELALVPLLAGVVRKRFTGQRLTLGIVAVWLVSGYAGITSAFLLVSGLSGQPLPADFAQTLASWSLTMFANTSVFLILFSAIGEYRQARNALGAQLGRLELLRDRIVSDVDSLKVRYESEIKENIEPVLDELGAALKNQDSNALADRSRSAIEEIVLPLAARIQAGTPVELEPIDSFTNSVRVKVQFTKLSKYKINVGQLFSISLVAIVFLVSLLPSFIAYLPKYGAMDGLIVLLLVSLAWAAFHFGFGKREYSPWIALLISVPSAVAIATGSVNFVALLDRSSSTDVTAFLSLGVAMMLAAYCIFQILSEVGELHLERLQSAASEYLATLQRRDLELRSLRARISQVVHGDVQGKLRAILLRVRSGELEPTMAANLDADIAHIRSVLSQVAEVPPVDLASELSALVKFWDGVCRISLELNPEALAAAQVSPIAASAVAEVAREAVANAIKHAEAGMAQISLEIRDSGLCLRIANPIKTVSELGRSVVASTFAGTALFDRLCQGWRLENVGENTIFSAKFAL